MSSPLLTPGEGGGRPAKPAPIRPSYQDDVEAYERRQEQRLGIDSEPHARPVPAIATAPDRTLPIPTIQNITSRIPTQSEFRAAQETDLSEAKLFEVCDYFCEQNQEAMTAMMNLIVGFDPDEEEEDIKHRVRNHLRIMGLNDAFGHGDWYTTPPEPMMPRAGTQITDSYFEGLETIGTAAHEVTAPGKEGPATVEAGGFEQPEINLLTLYYLNENFTDWHSTWTKKKELQDFLIGRLQGLIPGFDQTSISWDNASVQMSIALYRNLIGGEVAALRRQYRDNTPEHEEMKAEFDRAMELFSMAAAIPLDDSEAYAAAFSGDVYIPDAEQERIHVEDQLRVIYKYVLGKDLDHLATRSTTELKYELYYLLNYDVQHFLGLNENEILIQDFMKEYAWVTDDTPDGVIDRLQGTFHRPDVLGFLFIMGLSMAFEPVDWVLTIHDIFIALSEDDVESAIGNAILGAAPLVSSKLDDVVQPFLSRADNVPLLPARSGMYSRYRLRELGFSDELIDAMMSRGATSPGIGKAQHDALEKLREKNRLAPGSSAGIIKQNENFQLLRDQYGYNIINEPNQRQLKEVGFYERRNARDELINSKRSNPDYIIEGEIFDSYTVGKPEERIVPAEQAIDRIWDAMYEKVPKQTNRLVIDLSYTSLTPEQFIDDLSGYYVKGQPLEDPMLAALEEIFFIDNGDFTGIWIKPRI